MKEFNVIKMFKKVDLKSLVFLQLVDIAANQQPVCMLSIKIGSSNNYETKDKTLRNQAKQILTL